MSLGHGFRRLPLLKIEYNGSISTEPVIGSCIDGFQFINLVDDLSMIRKYGESLILFLKDLFETIDIYALHI